MRRTGIRVARRTPFLPRPPWTRRRVEAGTMTAADATVRGLRLRSSDDDRDCLARRRARRGAGPATTDSPCRRRSARFLPEISPQRPAGKQPRPGSARAAWHRPRHRRGDPPLGSEMEGGHVRLWRPADAGTLAFLRLQRGEPADSARRDRTFHIDDAATFVQLRDRRRLELYQWRDRPVDMVGRP